jgi:hypothetical protein
MSSYSVIGPYSHRDPVLTYLARGLPPETHRYALVEKKDAERWNGLSVTPIVFPTRTGRRREQSLVEALTRWGDINRLGLSGHRTRIAQLVRAGTHLGPEDLDYLQACLEHADRVRFFTEEAVDPEWLEWAELTPSFKVAIGGDGPFDAAQIRLASWFGSTFAAAHPVLARRVLARAGGHLTPTAWRATALALQRHRPSPADLAAWLPWLLRAAPDPSADQPLDYLLAGTRPGDDDEAAVLLLEFLTAPIPFADTTSIRQAISDSPDAPIAIKVRGSDYYGNVNPIWPHRDDPKWPHPRPMS